MTPYIMGLIHELKVANIVEKDNQNDGKEIGERVCKLLTTMARVSNKRKILELLLDEREMPGSHARLNYVSLAALLALPSE